ncbi:hypothetical protein [Solwaraspora sp. WMMD792]|uniref:hypothetical protein n=1 Tax=Solwaraspora sp. WMMD792 TaxID=3016099 RepID=UPI002415BF3B|nr:hypothetical protein [Solwaraspora sp. WMMD792]MDG4773400.1 hypothetical protein [Solwaraspora sp. WMMD792]
MTTFRHPRRSGIRSGRRSAPLAVALAVTVIGLLTACGGDGQDPAAAGGTATGASGSTGDSGVASIVGSTAPDASPSPPAERPLIRPDTSPEEEQRLYDVYQRCLEDNGLPKPARVPEGGGDSPMAAAGPESAEEQAAARKAAEACASLEPEELWERSMRLDPTYRDKLQVWVKCLQDRGVDAYAEGDSLMLNDGLPPGNEIEECEAEAFIEG